MADKVKVVSKGADGKVLLWEGDTFLSNDGIEREVELTPAVKRLLGDGTLVEVKGGGKAKTKGNGKPDVPPLRPATEKEEDAAGLEGSVEKDTAKVPTDKDGDVTSQVNWNS